jgi:type I restriction enzyme S subunit
MITATENTKAFFNTEIPNDWKVKKLGEISEIKTGDKDTQNKTDDGLYPFFVRSDNVERINSFSYDGEAILTSGDGVGVGKNYHYINGKFDFHQRVYSIRKFHLDVYGKFIYYYLSEKFYERVQKLSAKNSVDSVRMEMIFDMKIPLPPLSEQRAIAQVLSTADAAIHTTEKLIAQKELRKKWLMQLLLTGKKRLKGFDGEWKKERLENYLVKHDEKSTVNNQYPVLTSSRRGIFLQSDYYTRDVASENNTGYNVVPRGYFTYRHMSDDLIFKFNINDIVDRGIVSTLYPVFTTKDINSYFLLVKLNEGSEFKMHAEEQKQGGSRTYVYFKTLCQLKLNLPSIEEQTAISQVLQAADKEISLLKTKAEKLREQKKGLMQQLLTGKKRLNQDLQDSGMNRIKNTEAIKSSKY